LADSALLCESADPPKPQVLEQRVRLPEASRRVACENGPSGLLARPADPTGRCLVGTCSVEWHRALRVKARL
jgi:hypothetical protein